MKKLIFIIMTLMISLSTFAQNGLYPKIEKDSLGNSVIIMTIKQAMVLDNNSDLLKLYEQLGVDVENYDNSCLKVIDQQGKLISILNIDIATLKSRIDVKDEKIITLQSEVADYVIKNNILNEMVNNRQALVGERDKQITKLKTKLIIGGIGGGAIIIGLITLLITR